MWLNALKNPFTLESFESFSTVFFGTTEIYSSHRFQSWTDLETKFWEIRRALKQLDRSQEIKRKGDSFNLQREWITTKRKENQWYFEETRSSIEISRE